MFFISQDYDEYSADKHKFQFTYFLRFNESHVSHYCARQFHDDFKIMHAHTRNIRCILFHYISLKV